jgi:flagellar biosynthesis protein FliR
VVDPLSLLNVEKFLVFTLVLTRTSGLLIGSPLFGATQAPATIRALLSLALAVLIMPSQWSTILPYPGSLLAFIVIIGGELLIGLTLGLGMTILVGGIQMAGDMVSRVGGLSLADVFDPMTSTNVPLFSQLLSLLSSAVFMIIGGHRILLGGLMDTFHVIPPGGSGATFFGSPGGSEFPMLASLVEMIQIVIMQSFHLAIRAAAPVVAAVLLTTLVLGLISRTLPQLNVMVVGFGLNAMITFGVFFLSLGTALLLFHDQIAPMLHIVFQTLRIPPHSP